MTTSTTSRKLRNPLRAAESGRLLLPGRTLNNIYVIACEILEICNSRAKEESINPTFIAPEIIRSVVSLKDSWNQKSVNESRDPFEINRIPMNKFPRTLRTNGEEAFGEELNGPKPLFTARLSASRENFMPRSLL